MPKFAHNDSPVVADDPVTTGDAPEIVGHDKDGT
jgi:hypothetical protein